MDSARPSRLFRSTRLEPSPETRAFLVALRGAFAFRYLRSFLLRRGGFVLLAGVAYGVARAVLWWSDGPPVGTFDPPAVILLDPASFDMRRGEVRASPAIDPDEDLIPIFQSLPPGDPNGPERTWAVWSVREGRALARGSEWPGTYEDEYERHGRGLLGIGGYCILRAGGPPSRFRSRAWSWVSEDRTRLLVGFPSWNDDLRTGPVGPSARLIDIDLRDGAVSHDRIFHGIHALRDASPSGRYVAAIAVDFLSLPGSAPFGERVAVLDVESGETIAAPFPAHRLHFLDEDRVLCTSSDYLHSWNWKARRIESPRYVARNWKEKEAGECGCREVFEPLYQTVHASRVGSGFSSSGAPSISFLSIRSDHEAGVHHVSGVTLDPYGQPFETPWRLAGDPIWDRYPWIRWGKHPPGSDIWLIEPVLWEPNKLEALGAGGVALVRFPEGSVHPVAAAPVLLPTGRPDREFLMAGHRTLAVAPPLEGGPGIGFYPVELFLDHGPPGPPAPDVARSAP